MNVIMCSLFGILAAFVAFVLLTLIVGVLFMCISFWMEIFYAFRK